MIWNDAKPPLSVLPPESAFHKVFSYAVAHGVIVGVALPPTADPVPGSVLRRLLPKERSHAVGLRGWRQPSWVAGRLAAHKALELIGAPRVPLLSAPSGMVESPDGITLSISHKKNLAVALCAYSGSGSVGLDLENRDPPRPSIARTVLDEGEARLVESLPPQRRWLATLLHFSIKESIYKALFPYVGRYLGFHEASLDIDPNGSARVHLHLDHGEGPFLVEANYYWPPERLLTTVRAIPDRKP